MVVAAMGSHMNGDKGKRASAFPLSWKQQLCWERWLEHSGGWYLVKDRTHEETSFSWQEMARQGKARQSSWAGKTWCCLSLLENSRHLDMKQALHFSRHGAMTSGRNSWNLPWVSPKCKGETMEKNPKYMKCLPWDKATRQKRTWLEYFNSCTGLANLGPSDSIFSCSTSA